MNCVFGFLLKERIEPKRKIFEITSIHRLNDRILAPRRERLSEFLLTDGPHPSWQLNLGFMFCQWSEVVVR